jgi:DMSO/TMAO reductase YedYZ molybdopterin-dependent catalytic subunit
VNGTAPTTEPYQRLRAGGFADWRLQIDGLVSRPSALSLAELKGYPSRTHITHQACEEGWSFMPLDHGAPPRLKVTRQLGYQNLKYLSRITVTDSAKGIGDGLGSNSPAAGYSWYAGI